MRVNWTSGLENFSDSTLHWTLCKHSELRTRIDTVPLSEVPLYLCVFMHYSIVYGSVSLSLTYTLSLSSLSHTQLGVHIDPAALLPGATPPNRAQEEKAVSFDAPVSANTTLFNATKVQCHLFSLCSHAPPLFFQFFSSTHSSVCNPLSSPPHTSHLLSSHLLTSPLLSWHLLTHISSPLFTSPLHILYTMHTFSQCREGTVWKKSGL